MRGTVPPKRGDEEVKQQKKKENTSANADQPPEKTLKPKFKAGDQALHGATIYIVAEMKLVNVPPVSPYWIIWVEPISDRISFEEDELVKYTPHNHMQEAIVAAFGWDRSSVNWGPVRKASSQLRKLENPVKPEEIKSLHDFCAKKFDGFGPTALVNWVAEWRKTQASSTPKYVGGVTDEQINDALEELQAEQNGGKELLNEFLDGYDG